MEKTYRVEMKHCDEVVTFVTDLEGIRTLAYGQLGQTFDSAKDIEDNLDYLVSNGREHWTGGHWDIVIKETTRLEELLGRVRMGIVCDDIKCEDCIYSDTKEGAISCEVQAVKEYDELVELVQKLIKEAK